MINLAPRQKQIKDTLESVGWSEDQVINELPAIERIASDFAGETPTRFSKRHQPIQGSYLSDQAKRNPGIANALLENLSQKVHQEIGGHPVLSEHDPVDMAALLAIGADSIKDNPAMWQGMGLMKQYYADGERMTEADIIENRYAQAANMLKKFLQTNNGKLPFNPFRMGKNTPGCDLCAQKLDFSEFAELFRHYMDTLEPYMQLISTYLDKTMNAPTERIRHLKIYDEDGDQVDITDLDFSRFSQITSDSLSRFGDRKLLAMSLDDMTMNERYIEETRRYIDVFVVDKSISMGGTRILRAASFLYNRLDKVVKGWAMAAIVEFGTDANVYRIPAHLANNEPTWLINTPEKAKWAMANIIKEYTRNLHSSTNIPAGIMKGIEISKEMQQYNGYLPNITVVTDNDTSISYLDPKQIDIPVNGLALSANDTLQTFCASTGGMYNNLEQIELDIARIQQHGI